MPLMLYCEINAVPQPGLCYIQEARTSDGGRAAAVKFTSDRVITFFGEPGDDGEFKITSVRVHDPFSKDVESDLKGKCLVGSNFFSCTGKFDDGKGFDLTGLSRK